MASAGYEAGEAPAKAPGAEVDGASAEDTMFAFDVPNCKPGAMIKLTAPDGMVLQIPLPKSVLVGDRMHMEKSKETGKWCMKHVVRPQAVAQHNMDPSGKMSIQMRSNEELLADLASVHNQMVTLETTKGPLELILCASWAPLGAQRFLQLVTDQHFFDIAIYRGVPKFLVQFGLSGDPEKNNKYDALIDDPLRGIPVQEGSVCFAAAGPNSRKATICIFLGTFKSLGQNPWETPIGKVRPESMKVLHSLFTGYGDMPQCGGKGPDPATLEKEGNTYIKENFPECDFINSTSWTATWNPNT